MSVRPSVRTYVEPASKVPRKEEKAAINQENVAPQENVVPQTLVDTVGTATMIDGLEPDTLRIKI